MAPIDRRIDLNLFRVLDAIYTQGGISAAARQLHLTQPAVTHALNRLRVLFDDPLFVRQGNRVVPTERTRAVIADVQVHLKALQGVTRQQARFDPATMELGFSLGARDVLESIAFPSLIARLAREAPGVRIASRRVAAGDVERELGAGSLDMMVERRLRTGSHVRSERLMDESLVVAMRQRHPLASAALRRVDYFAARHVAVSPLGEPASLDLLLEHDGRFRHVHLTCQSYFAACQIAAESDLLLTMPASFAASLAPLLPIRVQPLPLAVKPIPILAYWHESKHEDRSHGWLRRVVIEEIRRATAGGPRAPRRPAG